MRKVNPILFSSTFILFACLFSEGSYAASPSGKDQLIENYHKVESYLKETTPYKTVITAGGAVR